MALNNHHNFALLLNNNGTNAEGAAAVPLINSGSLTSILAAACMLTVAQAHISHADEALYDEVPPEDAVFIRSFIGDADPQETGGLPASVVAAIAENESIYSSLSAGVFSFPEPGRFYAIVADAAGGLHLLPEPERSDRSKVHMILVNATDGEVRVTAPDHGMEVVAPTAPLSAAGRAVNPIEVMLAVENPASGAVLGTLDLRLRRGQDLTILVGPQGVDLIENAFGPVISGN
jgi:hypothetical protein